MGGFNLDPALYWLSIGVILLLLEMTLPGFVLFFFALGALVTSLTAWLTPISLAWQLALFMAASLSSLLLLRGLIQKRLFSPANDGLEKQERDEDLPLASPGDRGVVSATIDPPAEGRIKYGGSYWRATAEERIEEGEIISVVSQKGLIIHVERV